MVERRKATDEEIQDVLTELVVWHTEGDLRIMGRLRGHSEQRYLINAVRVDIDVLGRGPQGIIKSPNLGSIDYSKTPIPRYNVEKGAHYWVRDLDSVSAKFTAAMYIEFCNDLNNWEQVEEEMKLEALKQKAQQRGMIAMPMPGAMQNLQNLAKAAPLGKGGPTIK